MSKSFENFIYSNDGALSRNECEEIMGYTNDNMEKIKLYSKNMVQEIGMPPEALIGFKTETQNDFNYFWQASYVPFLLLTKVFEVIENGLREYIEEYPYVSLLSRTGLSCRDLKYHIVKKSGGYHSWHTEWSSGAPLRALVWHLSLTNHVDEGELEFLYYDRIPAVAGRLIIFPAAFPFVHRGNPIRTDIEKHYMTGWYTAVQNMEDQGAQKSLLVE